MRPRESSSSRGFFAATLLWAGGLVGLTLAYRASLGSLYESAWDPWRVAHHLVETAGLLLPFAAFAGGLAVERTAALRTLVARAILVGAASYAFTAYLGPLVDYRADEVSRGEATEGSLQAPQIPSTLRELRRAVQENPPGVYSHRASDLSAIPPSWWDHQLQWPWVVACFAVLSALLGLLCGRLTRALPPAARGNARWLLGLSSGVLFFVVLSLASTWIREHPSRSGILGTWSALLAPVAELFLLALWVRNRESRALSHRPGVDG